MKMQGAILGIVGLLLMAACGTQAPEPHLATSADDVVGTWQNPQTAIVYQFKEEGTWHMSYSPTSVEDRPAAVGDYWFEGTQLLWRDLEVFRVPSCGGEPAVYEVTVLETGNLEFVAIDDSCGPRRNDTVGEYEPVR